MSVSFLYFDLGNVLLSFSHERMLQQIVELTGCDAAIARQVIQGPGADASPSLQMQFETGLLSEDDYFENVCQGLGAWPQREAFLYAASDIFTPIESSIALVRDLHAAGNRLGVLSNTSISDWSFVTSGRFRFLSDCFERYALSFEAQSMKPDRRVFDHAIQLTGAPANEIFFTDDKPENIEGARASGIDAVLFRDAAKLRDQLRSRGVAGA